MVFLVFQKTHFLLHFRVKKVEKMNFSPILMKIEHKPFSTTLFHVVRFILLENHFFGCFRGSKVEKSVFEKYVKNLSSMVFCQFDGGGAPAKLSPSTVSH